MRLALLLDAWYLLGSLWAPPPPTFDRVSAMAGVTAFVHVNVIPMDTERILHNHTVVVHDGRITALGPSDEIEAPAGAVRIDGRGKYLIPGLADMHAHAAFALRSERDLLRYVAHGVTTVRDLTWYAEQPGLLRWRTQAAAGELVSPRIYAAGQWFASRDYDHGTKSWSLAPAAVAARLAAYKAVGYDFIKPHSESGEIFDSVVAAAQRLGLPVAGHVPSEVPVARALAARMHSIEHLSGYLMDGEDGHLLSVLIRADSTPDEAKIKAIAQATARAGVWNCPTLGLAAPLGIDTMGWVRKNPQARKFIVLYRVLVKALQEANAGLLLGTDGRPDDVVRELEAFVAAGLTPYEALLTGTRNVAEYFGILTESGTVAVGKRADLVLLPGNPLAEVGHAAEPLGVMLGGRWLGREELERRLAAARAGDGIAPAP